MLEYIGGGRAVLGVPARDLSDEEVERLGGEDFLLSLMPPLYSKPDKPNRKRNPDMLAAKALADKMEDGD
jgi:hypothetical protein